MTIGVNRDLDRAVTHLFFHVHDRRPALEEQRPECVTEIMKANLADSGLGQHREMRWQWLSGSMMAFSGDLKTSSSEMSFWPAKYASNRGLSQGSTKTLRSSRDKSTRLAFLLLVVVCSQRTSLCCTRMKRLE